MTTVLYIIFINEFFFTAVKMTGTKNIFKKKTNNIFKTALFGVGTVVYYIIRENYTSKEEHTRKLTINVQKHWNKK